MGQWYGDECDDDVGEPRDGQRTEVCMVSVMICGVKYDPSDDVDRGGLGIKGGEAMPT